MSGPGTTRLGRPGRAAPAVPTRLDRLIARQRQTQQLQQETAGR
ncbi:hypothetical protein ACPA9J_27960 [Pseudomonas aeruginosa]